MFLSRDVGGGEGVGLAGSVALQNNLNYVCEPLNLSEWKSFGLMCVCVYELAVQSYAKLTCVLSPWQPGHTCRARYSLEELYVNPR